MKHIFFFIVVMIFAESVYSQQTDSALAVKDTLNEVTVQAFLSNKKWKDVPVAVALITQNDLQRNVPTSLLPAVNAVPGVRMEERSPGSYRLSIRGSTLRSPFGVRNVKVYWNGIPLTDGGGNTYLNLVDVNQVTGAEIIKGPSSSVYGAGTGGVLLLKSGQRFSAKPQNHFAAGINGGSYGLFAENFNWKHQQQNFTTSLQQSHQQSDGYRQQSALRRDAVKWDGSLQSKKQQLHFLFFYTDLFYQTPGGITKTQMLQNPQLARTASGAIPGAIQQRAAIYNKTVFGGIHHTYQINRSFSTEASLMLSHTSFTNPFITNYENRDETNAGTGTKLIYHRVIANADVQWVLGGEVLYNHSRIDDYANKKGNPDTLQLKDDLYANQWFVFSQLQVNYGRFSFNAGLSLNNQGLHYKRLTDPSTQQYVNTANENVLAPRVAVLYKLSRHISLYSLAAKGFSPPTLAEVHPQDRIFHSELQPEYGWNIEAGLKGSVLNNRLQFDMATYDFELKNAIVIRNNTQGAQYFINAGGASEKGMEIWVKYRFIDNSKKWIRSLEAWSSYSYQPYYFISYLQGNNNYSGNSVTGVPKNIFNAGIDLNTKQHYYLHIVYNNNSSLPLNDGNDEFANAYHLLQCKMGKYFIVNKYTVHVFAGADNLLNELYSLGNDINAFGRRYYNPAAARSLYAGVSVRW